MSHSLFECTDGVENGRIAVLNLRILHLLEEKLMKFIRDDLLLRLRHFHLL